jgi:hypothetical protein
MISYLDMRAVKGLSQMFGDSRSIRGWQVDAPLLALQPDPFTQA